MSLSPYLLFHFWFDKELWLWDELDGLCTYRTSDVGIKVGKFLLQINVFDIICIIPWCKTQSSSPPIPRLSSHLLPEALLIISSSEAHRCYNDWGLMEIIKDHFPFILYLTAYHPPVWPNGKALPSPPEASVIIPSSEALQHITLWWPLLIMPLTKWLSGHKG